MTVEELIVYGKKFIHSSDAKMILASLIGCDTLELLLHLDEKISTEIVDKFKKMVQARKDNYPLQYIIGNVNFYGFEFNVRKKGKKRKP